MGLHEGIVAAVVASTEESRGTVQAAFWQTKAGGYSLFQKVLKVVGQVCCYAIREMTGSRTYFVLSPITTHLLIGLTLQ